MLDGKRVDAVEYRSTVEAQLLNYQNMAMRTLGFAFKIVDDAEASDCVSLVAENDLSFLGVVAISDPIRPDVPAAVAKCQSAGIGVKIVTGDTPGTATEIARQIGLWKPEDTEKNRITGAAFAELTDEEALDRVMDLKIMSRARPTDKQRLVQLLQQKGAVVAVTGDGTNDAPALNHAQVGLSMGTGTSVAKEASDITLLDDSFNSIGTAVMWGRSLYKNIQRFIVFQLTINFVALFIVLLGSLVGTTLPLTVTQMLWVNPIMDTFAALALASIPPSESVMKEKPRKSTDFIITKSMRYYILGMGSAFLVLLMGMLFWFNSEEGGDDYLSVDCVLHVLCYASVLELVQCTCVRHFGLGVQGHFQILWHGADYTCHFGRTDTDCTVWWSCIPHSAARFYDLDDDCRFYFVCFVDR